MNILMRIVFFMASYTLTLGASIAALEGGFSLSLYQMAEVPLVCHLIAFGTGCIGALDSKVASKPGEGQP